MKKLTKTLILMSLLSIQYSIATAQENLVPNPSFEEYDTCPYDENQLSLALGWNSYRSTPDYFNSCASNITFSVPQNVSYQKAATGNAYCGVYTFQSWGISNVNEREYIGVMLSSPLVIGTKYYISFKANLCGNENYSEYNAATNKLGITLSTTPYSVTNPFPIKNNAHIFSPNVISDTSKWTIISGSFIADSTYNYLILGCFFNDSNVNIQTFDFSGNYAAYYFIDDICVSKDSMSCNDITGISEVSFYPKIDVFPIPAVEFFTIEINSLKDTHRAEILVYDAIGRVIEYHDAFNSIPQLISTKKFKTGIYFIVVNIDNKSYHQKIIINKQ